MDNDKPVTLPPEMLPVVSGSVVVECPCGAKWSPTEFDECQDCGYPNATQH